MKSFFNLLPTPQSRVAGAWLLVLSLLAASALSARAQIGIGGIADKTAYTDQATFIITNEAGFAYDARLDGNPVPVASSVLVKSVDYHELYVLRTNTSTLAVSNRLVRFVVAASERLGTENGLPVWTPFPPIPSATGEFAGGSLRILAPQNIPQGLPIPVVARVEDAGGHPYRVNGSVTAPGQNSIRLVRGVGSGFLSASNVAGTLNYQPAVGGLAASKTITVETGTAWSGVSGTLNGSVNWPANSRIAITNQLTLAAGGTLTIGEGTIVRVSPGVSITNNAAVVINGTSEQPVVFAPVSPLQPWGGFVMWPSVASVTARGAIFTGSGANATWFNANGSGTLPFAHRREQALFFCASNNVINLTNCAAIRLSGQLAHGMTGGTFIFDHFLLQNASTGGEFTGSTWRVNDSAFIEFPDETTTFVDGDNDALYLVSGIHGFTNTLVGFTKDDGIDSGGSGSGTLVFSNCWIESAMHEGNSLSGTGKNVTHIGTVFINCGQGLESGYSGPNGVMNHCLATGNLVGSRLGDNYLSGYTYTGTLRATNSLLIYNYRDVWGVCFADWTYRISQMDIRSNLLTVPDSHWPSNAIWNPAADGAQLAAFINGPANSPVGIGFALLTNRLTAATLTNGLPVRLSRFSPNTVSVNYTAQTPSGVLASGTLVFQPGETVKTLALPIANPQSYELLEVNLSNPSNGEVTAINPVFTLNIAAPTNAPVALFPTNSVWRYLDNGVAQASGWSGPGWDDSAWSSGAGKFGFNTSTGNGPFATVLSWGSNSSSKYPAYYFRKQFVVDSLSTLASLYVEVLRDDGVALYLNGQDFYRDNLPAGALAYSQTATNCTDNGSVFQTATLPITALVVGTNVLAAEVHQSAITSSDLVFDMRLTANTVTPPPTLRQAIMPGHISLYWNDPTFALEEAPSVNGPWTPVADVGNPVAVSLTEAQHFYRLRR